jgi:hypothetical protein
MNEVVTSLARVGAYVGESAVPFLGDALDGIDISISTIYDMATMGVLTVGSDRFGDLVLALQPAFVLWSQMLGLSSPVPLFRTESNAVPLKKTKLELVLLLHRDAWVHAEGVLPPYVLSAPKVYTLDFKKCFSYFAALLLSDSLFQRGVTSIPHDASDMFYRCLIQMRGEQLDQVLADVANPDRDHTFYKALLKAADLTVEDEGDEELVPQICDGDVGEDGNMFAPMLPQIVDIGWSRVVVHVGGESPRLRIYFDHFSSASSLQRAFCNCSHHGCRWCRQVRISSKVCFCAML